MKIAFVMIHYPVAMGRYILEALDRRDDVELWAAGPFTGRWIPWKGGMHLPAEYIREPDHPMPAGASQPTVVYEILEKKCPFAPDLWLEVNAGLKTVGRPTAGRYAVVATDPHVLNYDRARAQSDYFFCMQKPYSVPGDHWLPYAYDPIWHSPGGVDFDRRQYDAALVGLQYPERTKLVQELRKQGREVFYELGPSYEDARAIYHRTRVGLNWSSKEDTTARVFELMAMGVVPVLNRVPDLTEIFGRDADGHAYLGFSDQAEAVAAVNWALENPDKSETIILNAIEAVRPHTWDARAETILETVNLLPRQE